MPYVTRNKVNVEHQCKVVLERPRPRPETGPAEFLWTQETGKANLSGLPRLPI